MNLRCAEQNLGIALNRILSLGILDTPRNGTDGNHMNRVVQKTVDFMSAPSSRGATRFRHRVSNHHSFRVFSGRHPDLKVQVCLLGRAFVLAQPLQEALSLTSRLDLRFSILDLRLVPIFSS